MTDIGRHTVVWRNGEDAFCLSAVGDIMALEEKCGGIGIMTIMRRLESDSWGINDVRETIRLGLIGGGMAPEKALAAVKLHVDGNPHGLGPSVILAHRILQVVMIGVPDDPVGKQPAAGAETQGQPSSMTMAASAAPPSSDLDKPLDGAQAKPTPDPSGKLPPALTATTEPMQPATSPQSL